jgi:hypothetical protein
MSHYPGIGGVLILRCAAENQESCSHQQLIFRTLRRNRSCISLCRPRVSGDPERFEKPGFPLQPALAEAGAGMTGVFELRHEPGMPGVIRLCSQRCQQRLGLLQVSGVKAFREPTVDWRQQLVRLSILALALP